MNDRRRRIMKRVLEALGWIAALCLFVFAGHSVLAQEDAPGRGEGAATRQQQQDRSRRARHGVGDDVTPASIVREARTIFVCPTRHLDKAYLEYKLQKQRELRDWELMLVKDPRAADLVIEIEKTALNYIFTVTDPRTRVIVTSGKTVAINGLVAAENLGREIIKKIRDVRASSDRRPKKKESDDEEDEWSES
jgi:hypothetical protein